MRRKNSLLKIIFIFVLILAVGNIMTYSAEKKEEGYLGITIADLNESEMNISGITQGAVITGIMDDSPAEKGGLQEYDVIQTFNDQKIEKADDLYDIVRETEPETKVTISYVRSGRKESTEVILGEKQSYKNLIHSSHPFSKFLFMGTGSYLGIHLAEVNADLSDYFGVQPGQGVLVLSVREDSPAEEAGIKAGDVIIKMGEEKIEDTVDIMDAISDYEEEEKIDITLIRHQKQMNLQVMIKEDSDAIDIYKWRGHLPGKQLRILGNRQGHHSFDFEIDDGLIKEDQFRKKIIRLKDKQIMLRNRIKDRIKRVYKRTISI